jgi:hypothetical protein
MVVTVITVGHPLPRSRLDAGGLTATVGGEGNGTLAPLKLHLPGCEVPLDVPDCL